MSDQPFPKPTPRKSALNERALNQAGESLVRERDRLVQDRLMPALIVALAIVMFTALEAWYWWTKTPRNPAALSIAALCAVLYAARQWRLVLPQVRRLSTAIEGERLVGQYLVELRARGFQVFQDVEADGFNLDHVPVGSRGIFVVDTKTHRKRKGGKAKVSFDGTTILVDGMRPDRDYVAQAEAARRWLTRLLHQHTGKTFPVRSVIAFPEWFVDPLPQRGAELWVVNPKLLKDYVAREAQVLLPSDVVLVSSQLSAHGRHRSELREARDR